MTIVKNHKEYEIDGIKWWVEKYADKPHFVWFWRYGYTLLFNGEAYSYIVSDLLRSRPNLKRLSFTQSL